MKYAGFIILFCSFPFFVKAENWRYSVEIGGSRSLYFDASKPIISTGVAVTAEGRTGASGQITFERSINRHLSVKFGTGINSSRLVRALYPVEFNDNKQVSGFGARSQEQVVVRPYTASLGLQANTNSFNRVILTGAIEGTISGNTGNFDQTIAGNSPLGKSTAITYGEVSFPYSLPNVFVTTSPLVWGATLRIGADYRLSENMFFTVSTAYHHSFDALKQYTDQLTTSLYSYPVNYRNTGNYLNFSIGLKRRISTRKPTEIYNGYNGPFRHNSFAQEGQNIFPNHRWFTSIAGGYWPGKLPQNLEYTSFINAHISYTPTPRLMAGLILENYWVRPSNFSHIYNQWLSGGPFVRYYLTNGRFSPFLEMAYQVGQRRLVADYVQTYTSTFSTYTATPGISIWLQRHVWLDISCTIRAEDERHIFGVTLPPSSSPTSSPGSPTTGGYSLPPVRNLYKGPLPQIGLTYQFGH